MAAGTLSGAPYSPLPGVPAVSKKEPPVACENDKARVTAYFAGNTKPALTFINKMTFQPLPGGRGFSGPAGLYVQAGGDPSKLPQ